MVSLGEANMFQNNNCPFFPSASSKTWGLSKLYKDLAKWIFLSLWIIWSPSYKIFLSIYRKIGKFFSSQRKKKKTLSTIIRHLLTATLECIESWVQRIASLYCNGLRSLRIGEKLKVCGEKDPPKQKTLPLPYTHESTLLSFLKFYWIKFYNKYSFL